MLTGSYHNYFRIFDVDSLSDVVLQADKSAFKQKKIGGPLPGNKLGAKNGTRGLRDAMQMETLDFTKKILHASWHPRENTIAVRSVLLSLRCLTTNIYYAPQDRCYEQLVFVQRCVRFLMALAGQNVQLCVVAFSVSSVLQYIPQSPVFPSTSVRPSSRSPFHLTPYLNGAHVSHLDHAYFRPLHTPPLYSLHLTPHPHPSPSSPTLVRISQCRGFRLTRQEVRKRRRNTIILQFLGAAGDRTTISAARWYPSAEGHRYFEDMAA